MRPDDSLDSFDLKILAHLQREGRCTNVELSNLIGISESPCLLRTKRMQAEGLIRSYGADVALEKLGEHVVVFSEVTLGSHTPQDFRRFEEAAAKHEEIVECYNVSGGYDYLLRFITRGVNHYQEVIEDLLAEMFAARAEDNRIALGALYSGDEYIQVQLVVTSKPADLLDDDLVMEDEA